jgi:phage-related protein
VSKRVKFFASESGVEPVREWIKSECSTADRKQIGEDIRYVQDRWPVGLPTCRPMGGGLYEVRSNLARNRIARILFGFVDGDMVLLHAFIKKTKKTPADDLKLATSRLAAAKGK